MSHDPSRALVERLSGHPGLGESSRTAHLTVVSAPAVRILDAVDLGDDTFALTLSGGDGVVVEWPRGVLSDVPTVKAWSSDDALDWATDNAAQIWHACFIGVAL